MWVFPDCLGDKGCDPQPSGCWPLSPLISLDGLSYGGGCCVGLGIKPRACSTLSKHFTSEGHPRFLTFFSLQYWTWETFRCAPTPYSTHRQAWFSARYMRGVLLASRVSFLSGLLVLDLIESSGTVISFLFNSVSSTRASCRSCLTFPSWNQGLESKSAKDKS